MWRAGRGDPWIARCPAGVLAAACPNCNAAAGTWCCGPSGHAASNLHQACRIEADRLFIEQHGELAAIIRAASGWMIDPQGRVRD